MGDDVRDLLAGELLALHSAQLEALLGVANAVQHVAALGVVDQAELEVSLGDLRIYHKYAHSECQVHEKGRLQMVSP
mgnify:CR=1 FL=1